jgi:hypothetical protein
LFQNSDKAADGYNQVFSVRFVPTVKRADFCLSDRGTLSKCKRTSVLPVTGLGGCADLMTDNSLFRDLRHRSAMGGGPDTAGERRVVWERSYYSALKGAGESLSGTGSSLVQTQVVRARLDGLLGRIGAASILDAPCGDHHWMSHVGLAASYVGVDIVPELIERNRRQYPGRKFLLADIVSDDLPPADLILCRDALVH